MLPAAFDRFKHGWANGVVAAQPEARPVVSLIMVDTPTTGRREVWRGRWRLLLALFYGLAGILHLALPAPFLTITPAWVPDAPAVIAFTGLCEIAGAIGLLVPAVRRYAGMALGLYAVCVFPANIKHAVDSLSAPDASFWPWLYHVPRLALQPVLVWLALFAGGSLPRER